MKGEIGLGVAEATFLLFSGYVLEERGKRIRKPVKRIGTISDWYAYCMISLESKSCGFGARSPVSTP